MDFKQAQKERDGYWDVVKAVLIFLVILGHVVQFIQYQNKDFWDDSLFKGIYLFHMPLFMLISGYFASKSLEKRGKQAIIRYLKRLSLPCLGMGGVFLVFVIIGDKSIWSIYGGCVSLWFLIVVFQCLICYMLLQLKQAVWYKIVMFFLPIPAAMIVGDMPYLSLLWPHTYHFTYLWPIFVLGAYMAKKGFNHDRINWKWSCFLLLYVFSFLVFRPTWYVYRLPLSFELYSVKIDILRTVSAIVGCGMVLWICKYLFPFLCKFSIVESVGRSTLAIYVLQTWLFMINYSDFIRVPLGRIEVVCLSLTILFLLYVIYIMSRKVPLVSVFLYGEQTRRKEASQ